MGGLSHPKFWAPFLASGATMQARSGLTYVNSAHMSQIASSGQSEAADIASFVMLCVRPHVPVSLNFPILPSSHSLSRPASTFLNEINHSAVGGSRNCVLPVTATCRAANDIAQSISTSARWCDATSRSGVVAVQI
jgi:hypothetical protein